MKKVYKARVLNQKTYEESLIDVIAHKVLNGYMISSLMDKKLTKDYGSYKVKAPYVEMIYDGDGHTCGYYMSKDGRPWNEVLIAHTNGEYFE